jgi:CheY-specific phosphatase CheX
MQNTQPQTLKLNDDLAKEIIFGVHSTFTSMFGLRPTAEVHSVENQCSVTGDISGIIGLSQGRIEGALIVSFPLHTIFAILGKMYKKEFTGIDKSVRAGVGELTNIIYGVMKTNLNKNGFEFRMALPNVIIGDQQHTAAANNQGATLVLPFQTEAGSFTVLLTLYPDQLANSSKAA